MKQRCDVCGHRFTPTKTAIYTVQEAVSPLEALSKPQQLFDAMDCPQCGCQMVLAFREPRKKEADETVQLTTKC